jgi:hypothetical protein
MQLWEELCYHHFQKKNIYHPWQNIITMDDHKYEVDKIRTEQLQDIFFPIEKM